MIGVISRLLCIILFERLLKTVVESVSSIALITSFGWHFQ